MGAAEAGNEINARPTAAAAAKMKGRMESSQIMRLF